MYSRRHSGGSGDCGDSGADFARGGRNAWCTFAALTANPIAAAACAQRCHFADEEVLRAFEHFLFAEGERLAAAERNETLEDDGDFEEGPGAHALGILFEAVLPVVMRVEFAGFEEAKDFGGFCGPNN